MGKEHTGDSHTQMVRQRKVKIIYSILYERLPGIIAEGALTRYLPM